MLGLETVATQETGFDRTAGLFNASLFRDLNLWSSAGVETNFRFGSKSISEFKIIPELHVEILDGLIWQVGAGAAFRDDESFGLVATRVVLSN